MSEQPEHTSETEITAELVEIVPGMLREISVERLYTLGQYKNIKLNDTISNIPEKLWLNPDVMAQLRQLQMYSLDAAYFNYIKDSLTQHPIDTKNPKAVEEVIELLDSAKVTTTENLKETFASAEQN